MYHQNTQWYTRGMPTSRRRYQVTETDEVARALDEAALVWPGEPRSRLIVRAIVAGGGALAQSRGNPEQLGAIRRVRGTYGDAYGPGYLSDLRNDWPA